MLKIPLFFRSIRAKLLLIALLLLLIPIIGFRFVREMDGYLRDGQQQVLSSAARLLSASLSDRPQLFQVAGTDSAGDSVERQRLLAMFSSADPEAAASLGTAYVPSEDIEKILNVVASSASRIWVVDAQSRVRGLAGALNSPRTSPAQASQQNIVASAYSRMIRPVVRLLAPDPAMPTHEDGKLSQRVVMSQVERALVGEANSRWRLAADGPGEILSVAQPVWQSDNIVGAVVLEETASSRQSIRFAALESLLGSTIIVFLVGFVALLGFAWRLASRVRRLQKEAEATTDSHGRILGRITSSQNGSEAEDEIGALAHTLDAALQRLSRYNGYLEQMSARLSHELRTPLAVVRSSLDNLRQGDLATASRVYVDRADEGVRRLAGLISRMSEATQLEGLLRGAERTAFDLAVVAKGCVEGYRTVYSRDGAREFVFSVNTDEPMMISGMPDALAQLLDKLVQNAVDFATPGTAILVSMTSMPDRVSLSVENKGPQLPADAVTNLFVSMVSSRGASASGDHLGLGLYIVRLIAEFHEGVVSARNLSDGSGVRFEVSLPRAG